MAAWLSQSWRLHNEQFIHIITVTLYYVIVHQMMSLIITLQCCRERDRERDTERDTERDREREIEREKYVGNKYFIPSIMLLIKFH